MPLISYMKTTTNKRLLISENRADLNRYTPCKENLINTLYTFHARMTLDHMYLMWFACSNLSLVINGVVQMPYS
jgi:hypothetical protein